MVAVDVLFSYLWMAVLLWMAANHQRLDRSLNADTTAITALSERMERLRLEHERIPALADLMIMLGLAFGATGLSHALAAPLAGAFTGVEWAERLSLASEFFWIVVLATTFGLLLSFTRARQLEGAGASRLGTALSLCAHCDGGHADEHRRRAHEPRAVRHRIHLDGVPRRRDADRRAPDQGAHVLPRRR